MGVGLLQRDCSKEKGHLNRKQAQNRSLEEVNLHGEQEKVLIENKDRNITH